MLTGNIADLTRSVRTFYGQAKALSGNQGIAEWNNDNCTFCLSSVSGRT